MIEVQFFGDKEKFLMGFQITGHALSAPFGKDIICAGISALAQGIVIGLEEVLAVKIEKKKQLAFCNA